MNDKKSLDDRDEVKNKQSNLDDNNSMLYVGWIIFILVILAIAYFGHSNSASNDNGGVSGICTAEDGGPGC